MSGKQDCGRERSCGGWFTDGPGDSEWRDCARHAADRCRFFELYFAEIAEAAANADEPRREAP